MNEIATQDKNPQVTQKDLDDYLFGTDTKLDDRQKKMFFSIAMAFNLNPLKREIYAIKYGNNFNIITGFETYLKRAERTGLIDWWEAGTKKDGNELIGWCSIKRKDRSQATTIEAWFSEYNQGTAIWKSKPKTMIRKVAIAQAFRMVFPEEIGGMPYEASEMGETENIIEVQPQIEMTRTERMIYSLNDAGKLGNAEKFIGKPSTDWTDADIDKIEAAKKKNGKKSSPESSVTPLNPEPDTISQAEGESAVRMITDAQIDQIEELCRVKNIIITAALPDGCKSVMDMTYDQAEAVIKQLGSL